MLNPDRRLKDPQKEKTIFFARSIFAVMIVVSLFGVILFRLYQLQIVEFEHYQTLSDDNRMQLRSVAPTRGLIYDRNGILLADNRPVFSVNIVREDSPDIEQTINQIASIIEITEFHRERFAKRLKRARRPFQPVVLKSKLSEEEIARLSVRRHQLPGMRVSGELARHYPLAEHTAHAIGYVGRINEIELESVDAKNYSATQYIGKLGIEKFYESALHGFVGHERIEANASNRTLRVLDRVDPAPGTDLTLHLDANLQIYGAELLDGKRGAIVAIEPDTGGILALVSTPSFDPNLFVTGIDHKSYAALRDSIDIPLFNRALKGQYPPASTIKPMLGLGALNDRIVSPAWRIWDSGKYQLENDERIYRGWKREGLGWMNLHDAIVQSSDVYFYDVSFRWGVDRMSYYLDYFGFGSRSVIDIAEARSGILPSREWKSAVKGLAWYPGDTLNFSIGQGFMLATPLQLATATAVLATRGQFIRPRLLRSASGSDENLRELEYTPQSLQVSDKNWDIIIDSMKDVMHGPKGTARSSGRGADYQMGGKTGTAQVVSIPQGEEYDEEALAERHRDHALFVGFAPLENPQIAVAVIVENGGGGSTSAAPVARKLFDHWLGRKPVQQSEEAAIES